MTQPHTRIADGHGGYCGTCQTPADYWPCPVASGAVALAKQVLAPGSVYTFAAYRDARRLAELVLAQAGAS